MSVPLSLLTSIGKAVIGTGLNVLAGGFPIGTLLVEIADAAFREWSRQRDEQQRRAELQALAQANLPDVRRQVADVVQQVAADQPPQVQKALADYLNQVPNAVRQSLRRPADPSGRTVPAGLAVRKAEDLVPFLPTKLPRFKKGDRPMPALDLELDELLGVGGFGEVWKARNPHLPNAEAVALKFCLDASAAAALRNEALLLDRVRSQGRHPGIVALLRTYLSADPPCLEYEFVEGGDLGGLIQEWHREKGGPTPAEAARLTLRLAEVVAHAHALKPAIVHRDLKPANVLVERSGTAEGVRLRVTDFGIGGLAASGLIREATRGGTSHGDVMATVLRGAYTPLYASPQQMRGSPPDPRDDVHALGVIWYQMLTGDLGSAAPTGLTWPESLKQRGMSHELVMLLGSCIESRQEQRPADAGELANRLRALLTDAPKHPVAIPWEDPPPPRQAARTPVAPPKYAASPDPATGPKEPPVPRPAATRSSRTPGRGIGLVVLVLGAALGVLVLGGLVVGAIGYALMTRTSTAQVYGKVTYNGQPLASGSVSFYKMGSSEEKLEPPITTSIRDGSYSAQVPPGIYKVVVVSQTESSMKWEGKEPFPDKGVPGPRSLIPMRYSDPGTTPLQIEIMGKSVPFDIIIEDYAP